MRRVSLVLSFLAVGLLSVSVRAQTSLERAVGFLANSVEPSGSWSSSRQATTVRDTSTVVSAFAALGMQGNPVYQAGVSWLANERQRRRNVDDVSRTVAALHGSGLEFMVADEVALLIATHLRSGGWGLGFDDNKTSVLDTTLAAEALLEQASFEVGEEAVFTVAEHQNLDGGWGVHGEASLVSMTGEVLVLFGAAQPRFPWLVLGPTVDRAVAFLVASQQPDGRMGTGALETALAVRGLLASGRPVSGTIAAGLGYLASTQMADGSWGGDPNITAQSVLAIRASGPNLAVGGQGIVFSPSSPVEGDTVQLAFTVENTGAAAAGAFAVRVLRGSQDRGELIGEQVIAGLAAGEQAPVVMSAATTGLVGGQTFTLVVDSLGQVLEANEADNIHCYYLGIRVRRQPDLVVTANDLQFTPPRVGDGDAVDVTATIRNDGNDDVTEPVAVRFYDGDPTDGGMLLGTQTLAGVPALGEASAVLTGLSFPVGLYAIYTTIDEENLIVEALESNNLAWRPLVVTEHVDLVVAESAVTFSPASTVTEGTTVTVYATIVNEGIEPANGVTALLASTGQIVDVGTLAAGAAATVSFSLDTTGLPGFQRIEVVVDPDDQISELAEGNNTAVGMLDVTPLVDLYLANAATSPLEMEGNPVILSIWAYNAGDVTASNVEVAVFDGLPEAGGIQLSAAMILPTVGGGFRGLPGAKYMQFAFSTVGLAPGTSTLYAVVDPA
ncbi:MAG: CARDB domain-containing protein, partial [Pseudomonadota bacterium]